MDEARMLPREGLERLFQALKNLGYPIIGPGVEAGAIRFKELASARDLPWGVADDQQAATYRLIPGPDSRAFHWTTAPLAAKPLCFSPDENLWRVKRHGNGKLGFEQVEPQARPAAVIGLRACDLAALALQDRHFLDGGDPWYSKRRKGLFIVAVNCARSAATCFCASTGDGPAVKADYDLLLDELDRGYLVRAGSTAGRNLLDSLALDDAGEAQIREAAAQTTAAAAAQTRRVPADNLEEHLNQRRASAAWAAIAERCLACGNCTSVCPTCFCHRHRETPDLDGQSSLHGREWDSCFSEGHSLIHGRTHRAAISHRYRQWLSHKFGAWHSQYGRSGCTGCGRCITWCPVGIDVTISLSAVLEGAPR